MSIKLISAQRDETTTKESMNLLCLGLKAKNLSDEKDTLILKDLQVKDFAVCEKSRPDAAPMAIAFIRTPGGAEYATRSSQIIEALCLYSQTQIPISALSLRTVTGKNGDYLNLEGITSGENQKAAFTYLG